MEDINSGRDVPTETMATPTINGDSRRKNPNVSDESINQSDALISTNKLTANIPNQVSNSNILKFKGSPTFNITLKYAQIATSAKFSPTLAMKIYEQAAS
ncbi:hypothetical protein AY600_12810 [Phormidium willei BDU 130791]|nr:hypothetical protein AY600_12810 [Phormidium willei BDU 130791]